MKIKSLFVCCAAVAVALTSAAFELGKDDAVIYHSKVNKVAANEMSLLLNKVFGKKYTVKSLSKAEFDKPGIYVGFAAPGQKYSIPADKKEFIGTYADDTRLFLWGNDKENLKGSAFAVFDFVLYNNRVTKVTLFFFLWVVVLWIESFTLPVFTAFCVFSRRRASFFPEKRIPCQN